MLSHYFKLAKRDLFKNKYYAFINVFGLVFGMLSALIIAKYIGGSLQFDNFHKKKNNIYAIAREEFVFRFFHSRTVLAVLLLTAFLSAVVPSNACTVFILTNGKQTFFFNNEDFTNPNSRIWFIPSSKGHSGAAYVGFNDGEPQGGINTEGLAFDWVTVDMDSYSVDPNYVPEASLLRIDGNTSQWMLERCRTVAEAIKFYQTYREPAFAKTTLAIADKSGASVIIGSKNGKLYFDTAQKSRGLGFGEATFNKQYKAESDVDFNDGVQILKQCVAPGNGGTKYSNTYDLNNGDIEFYNFVGESGSTKFNLLEELKKGSHYYEIPDIKNQIQQEIRPLLLNMNRHILFNYTVLSNQEPTITAEIKNLFSDVTNGKLRYDDLTADLTNNLKQNEAGVKSMLERLGKLNSIELIDKTKNHDLMEYSYIMKFDNVRILWQFILDDKNKIHDFNTLSASWIR